MGFGWGTGLGMRNELPQCTDPRQGEVVTQRGTGESCPATCQEGKGPRGPGNGRWSGPREGVPGEGAPDGSAPGCSAGKGQARRSPKPAAASAQS